MKKLSFIIFTFVILISQTNAQFNKGKIELSFVGNVSSFEESMQRIDKKDTYKITLITLAAAPEYYLVNGFSFGVELGLMASDKRPPAQWVLPYFSYTYLIPESKFGVFCRAGYGFSNVIQFPYLNGLVIQDTKRNVKTIGLGIGTKYLMSDNVLIRAEIIYKQQRYNSSYSSYFYSYSNDYTYSSTGLLVGFSIIL